MKTVYFTIIIIVEFKYNLEEITKIFINLNFLKRLDMPENLKENFINALFNNDAKTKLEHFKRSNEVRARSNTLHNYLSKSSNNIRYITKIFNKLGNFNRITNINYNSSGKLNKFESSECHDEYNNLRHVKKNSVMV